MKIKNLIFWKNTKAALRADLIENFNTDTLKKYEVADKQEGIEYSKYLREKNK